MSPEFPHTRVAGIAVPEALRRRMAQSADPVRTGITNAREMLHEARRLFAGACLMPPFDHYEILREILVDPPIAEVHRR